MKRIKIVFFMILSLLQLNVYSQVMGYGAGIDSDPNWSSGIFYTDSNRARVDVFTPFSSSITAAQLTISNVSGSFAANDYLLIIQMTGTGIGTHQLVQVTTVVSSTVLDILSAPGDPLLTYTPDAVQIIKVRQYRSFTLNGGQVTCHPWDGREGTGGVLCLMTDSTLTVNNNNSSFSVKGKGFRGDFDNPGITWGAGGAGGSPSAAQHLQDALLDAPGAACLGGVGTVPINQGEKGGSQGASSSAQLGGANTGSASTYGGAYKNTLLVMGDPGGYNKGYGGANAGIGGGWGGDGAASICGNPGNSGLQGISGWNGKRAGIGGTGGGAMLIKAMNVVINTSRVVFDASGEKADEGGDGGNGGNGGKGGDGGLGCCESEGPVAAGGIGGSGDIGDGGDGGDGGNGGYPGYIWIGTKSYTKPSGIPRSANFSAKGGKGGKGGLGGWGHYNITPVSYRIINECTEEQCDSSGSGPCGGTICDPDQAMCLFSSMVVNGYFSSGASIDFFDSSPSKVAEYISNGSTGGTLNVFVSDPSCADGVTYVANCHNTGGQDCDVLFANLAGLDTVGSGATVHVLGNASNCYNLPLLPLQITYFETVDPSVQGAVVYRHKSQNQQPYLMDNSLIPDTIYQNYATFSTCYSSKNTFDNTYGPAHTNNPELLPVRANDGNEGTTPAPGSGPDNSGTPGNPDDNIVVDDGDSWFRKPNTGIANTVQNALNLTVFPNPADKELNIEFVSETNDQYNIAIYDLSGKQMLVQKVQGIKGKNKLQLDVSKLSKGFYMLKVECNQKESNFKITVQ